MCRNLSPLDHVMGLPDITRDTPLYVGPVNADTEGAARSFARLKALEQALPGLTVHLGHQEHAAQP